MNKIEFMLPRYAEYKESFTGIKRKVIILGFVACGNRVEAVVEKPWNNSLMSIDIIHLRII